MLIGLSAPMHCGKTTVAQMMARHLDAEIISFATPLKRLALEMGWNGQKDVKGRRLLQLLGTECGRKCIDPHLWRDKWLKMAKASTKQFVIADDCRFVNEAQAIIDAGGLVYRITGREPREQPLQGLLRCLGLRKIHESERPLPEHLVTGTIPNNMTLCDLSDYVETLCDSLIIKYGR